MKHLSELYNNIHDDFSLTIGTEMYDKNSIKERVDEYIHSLQQNDFVAVVTNDAFICTASLLAIWKQNSKAILISSDQSEAMIEELIGREKISVLITDEGVKRIRNGTFHHPGLCVLTSGTTGKPKIVHFPEDPVIANIDIAKESFGFSETDTILSPVSNTVTGLIMMLLLPSILSGSKVILKNITSPSNLVRTIETSNCTVLYGIPFLYKIMVNSQNWKSFYLPESVRLVLSSTSELDYYVNKAFYHQTGKVIYSIYCSSEVGMATINTSLPNEKSRGLVGQPVTEVSIKVLDASGKQLQANEVGRIFIKSPYCAKEYLNVSKSSDQTFTPSGIYTGDTGFIDYKGNVYVHGRESNVYNIAGYLVYPQEIETVIEKFPAVEDSLVVQKDTPYGNSLRADLVGENINLEELRVHCSNHLPKHKLPRDYNIVKNIPRNQSGKKIYPGKCPEVSI
jgi:long-chain acyl-CoA synthetase